MQKAHGEFYGKVDKIRIIINPAKFKVSGGGRAFHTVSIAYTHNGDADVKIGRGCDDARRRRWCFVPRQPLKLLWFQGTEWKFH